MLALIDGDIVAYRTGYASEKEDEAIACVRANKTIEDCLQATGATEYQVWLSDSLENNYRYKIDPKYKSSRQNTPKPKHLKSLKSFLVQEWGAQVTPDQEADDILGILQTDDSVICSNDKDMLQIPGNHFNFVRKEYMTQTYLEGLRWFYSQFLIGDKVDDIIGIYGLGPVKTAALLKSCETEQEMFEVVRYQYKDDERLLKNGRLLWIRRKPNEIWNFPNDETVLQDESGINSDSTDGHGLGQETSSGSILL